MSDTQLEELSALTDLSIELTPADCKQIRNSIGLPEALSEDAKHGVIFLIAFKEWKQHRPYRFYTTLQDIRPDLLAIACEVPWLCASSPREMKFEEEEITIKSLIDLLKTEVTRGQWVAIYMVVAGETNVNVGFKETLELLLDKGLIQSDLKQVSKILRVIQRNDLVEKLREYQRAFVGMGEGEFESKFRREVSTQSKEMVIWELKLKQFVQVQYGTVQQMIGKDKPVSLSEVYVDLTILKQEPREINLEDETTYNEIAYLRNIANREVDVSPVDFTEELTSYKPTEPQIWCMIGNPGCGKTFLAKRTALRFSSNELVGIIYSISVPCRHPDWHSMEATRHEEEKKVESAFIQKWLCLGLPIGSSWSVDLAKHLHRTDGEGLLLIIDGLDELREKFPLKTHSCVCF